MIYNKDASISELMEGARRIYQDHVKANPKPTEKEANKVGLGVLAAGLALGYTGAYKKPVNMATRVYQKAFPNAHTRATAGYLDRIHDDEQ